MKRRQHHDERQLGLNFQPTTHPISWARKSTHGALADRIQAEDRLRLLEPTSLPKVLRGWEPRARPQTAIIAYAAQRAYERRMARERGDAETAGAIHQFLTQRAGRLSRLAKQLRQ